MSKLLFKAIKKLAFTNYHTAKLFQKQQFAKKHDAIQMSSRKPLLIFQMGKVGSTTVFRSIKARQINIPTLHIHVLARKTRDEQEKVFKKVFSTKHIISEHLLASEYVWECLQSSSGQGKWKVISLVRDPIARNLSTFIQDVNIRQPEFGFLEKCRTMEPEELSQELVELFIRTHDHNMPLNWFDMELNKVFQVDVFATDFPKNKGYDIYENEQTEVLLLKLEKLNDCAVEALKKFLDLDEISLINSNIGSKKEYSEIYKAFLDQLVLPDSYLDKMYSSKLATHFYGKDELDGFRNKWSKKFVNKRS